MKSLSYLVVLLVLFACTPKVVEQTVQTPTPPATPAPPPSKDLSPCQKWIGLPNMDELRKAHVLYRDNLKLIGGLEERGDEDTERISALYAQAFSNWQKVYKAAPAADGKRADHYEDGIAFYDYFYFETTDKAKQQVYLDSIKILYNEMADCYGDAGFVYGSMAYDFYYRYEGMMNESGVYQLYKKSMDAYGDEAKGFVIVPFTSLMVKGVREKTINAQEAQNYAAQIQRAIKNGTAKCAATKDCDEWETTKEDVDNLLAILETEKGFFDCDYFKAKYLVGKENLTDCDELSSVIGRVRWGGCGLDDPDLAPLVARFNGTCVSKEEPTVTCRSLLQEGNPKGAVDCYLEKAGTTEDMEKKAQYLLVVAKIYYGEIRKFSLARKYALEAAAVKPNWGEPFMLIGKLYASSGPLCGPGRGWDSQIVTWPAIDTWQKAKRIDPSVAPEANKLINRYAQYMPDTEAIFIRGLAEGQDFKVPCWIQRSTKIRAAK